MNKVPFIGSRPIAAIDGLGDDDVGVWYFGKLFPTLAAGELVPLLEAGVLGSSFRFSVVREQVADRPARSERNPERLPERTILEATVYEFGPVVFPAYRGATAAAVTGEHPAPPRSAPRDRRGGASSQPTSGSPTSSETVEDDNKCQAASRGVALT